MHADESAVKNLRVFVNLEAFRNYLLESTVRLHADETSTRNQGPWKWQMDIESLEHEKSAKKNQGYPGDNFFPHLSRVH